MLTDKQQPIFLHPSRREQAADILLKAFLDDIVYNFLFPDSKELPQKLRRHLRSLLVFGLVYGEVYTNADVSGVACWLPALKTEPAIRGHFRSGFSVPLAKISFSRETRKRMKVFKRFNDEVKARAVQEPHWFLDLLAVDPACQRQGSGGRLLEPRLSKCDEKGLPCYLETETEGNVHFYEKYGFKVVNDGKVPGYDLRIWAMLRQPQ